MTVLSSNNRDGRAGQDQDMAPPPAGPIPPRQEPSALRRAVSGSSIPIVQRVLAARASLLWTWQAAEVGDCVADAGRTLQMTSGTMQQ